MIPDGFGPVPLTIFGSLAAGEGAVSDALLI
jgi:hypothetical protein